MQFDNARWSLGGPGWSPGVARGLPGGYGVQNECFCKFGKRCFLAPWREEGGLGGSSPHYRAYLAPWHLEGGLGGPSPHSRAYLAPLSEEGGLGGSSPHSRANLGLFDESPFLLKTIHREGTGYAGACHQHVYLIESISIYIKIVRIEIKYENEKHFSKC